MKPLSVLVIAAHADDEVMGCGGTIAKMARQGARTAVYIATQPGGHSRYQESLGQAQARRQGEAQRAAQVLGAEMPIIGDREELSLTEGDVSAVADSLRQQIERTEAEVVFTHHRNDLHFDHRAIAEATIVATRPFVRTPHLRRVLMYQQIEVGAIALGPSVFIDISQTLEAKIEALLCYESELRPFPHPRSREAISARAMLLGSHVGVRAAEAFDLVWEIA